MKSNRHFFRPALIGTVCLLSLLNVRSDAQTSTARGNPSLQFEWAGTNFVARGGWGRMIPLTNGQWLCVNTRFARDHSTLQIRVSTNRFASWTLLSEIGEHGRFMDNGELIRLPDGAILLAGRSLIAGRSYRLPVYRSLDSGRTWTAWSDIDSNESRSKNLKKQGLWEPHFFRLDDGRLAVAYANEKHSVETPAFSQVCSERISPDGGKTWGAEIILAAQTGGGSLRPGMPVVTRMANGEFIAVYEVVGVGDADVYFKISDDGVNWPAGLGTRVPGQHAGPWVTSLSNGGLLLTSCANTLSRSRDFGKTWLPAEPPAWSFGPGTVFTWPAIYELGAGRIAVMISRRGVRMRFGSQIRARTNSVAAPDR